MMVFYNSDVQILFDHEKKSLCKIFFVMQRQLNVELSKCDIYWHLGSILPYDISDLSCYMAFIL